MKKNKKKSKFGANMTKNREKRKKEASGFEYLNLPKDFPVYKEKVGTCELDIMPYIVSDNNHPDGDEDNPDSALKGNQWYRRPIWVHRNVGAENEIMICPKTDGKKCPICDTRDQQFRDGMDKDDVVKKASARSLFLVIPKKHKKYDEELHIWDISDFCFHEELDDEREENPEHDGFPDLENGETLSIRFKEDSFGQGNKFVKAKRIEFLERKKQYPGDTIDDSPCLDDLFEVPSYKEIEAKFLEIEEDDAHEKEEGSTEKKDRKTKAFDDDLDDAPTDEHEKEEEPSSMKRKDKKKKKDKSGKKNKCPEGYKYGKDWDAYENCDDCKVFKACGKKHEKLEAAA